ncbi:type IV secretion system protein, partial [Erythrobacter sp. NE805]|uniref:type IV secretion system protein n=1 Tax=Erythrobacter sp. NE805 TaxID=3389875 RepID=UPI00396B2282
TKDIAAFSPPGMMWMGALLLLLGTVGLLVTSRIALALLLAVGPIFVVLALFEGTRGLFTGWLKGLVMLALAPLFAVLGGSIMLEMAVPVLQALTKTPGKIDQQAAMAFFVVGFVHAMLMLMALVVSAMMVRGWQVFGLVPAQERERSGEGPRTVVVPPLAPGAAPRGAVLPPASPGLAPRRVEVAPLQPGLAANDTGPEGNVSRETRVVAATGSGAPVSPLNPPATRTRGIGNRFRTASSSRGTAPTATTPPETYR